MEGSRTAGVGGIPNPRGGRSSQPVSDRTQITVGRISEREVTGERIRDKIAASKAQGMWMGATRRWATTFPPRVPASCR